MLIVQQRGIEVCIKGFLARVKGIIALIERRDVIVAADGDPITLVWRVEGIDVRLRGRRNLQRV